MRVAVLFVLAACYGNNPPPQPAYGPGPGYAPAQPVYQQPPASTHSGICTPGSDGQGYCGAGYAGSSGRCTPPRSSTCRDIKAMIACRNLSA